MLFKFDECSCCRSCELACSFHLTGGFNFNISGIEIVEKQEVKGYDIRLYEFPDGERLACDGCIGEEEACCLDVCHAQEELQNIIKEFIEKQALKNG